MERRHQIITIHITQILWEPPFVFALLCRRSITASPTPTATAKAMWLLLLLAAVSRLTACTEAFVTTRSSWSRSHSLTSSQRWTAAFSSNPSSSTSSIEYDDVDETELSASLSNSADGLKVTKLESLTDFLKFIAEDDRLCVIK